MSSSDRLVKGDTVLVTGVTGFLGASTADALISRGYKVRGVTRDAAKAEPLKLKLEKLYGPGFLSFVEVKDAAQPGAYKDAVKGVDGIIHLALDGSASFGEVPDPEASIKSAIDMTIGILKSAVEVPSIKSVVVTSSCVSHYSPEFGKDIHPTVDQWNDAAVKMAYDLPVDHPFKGIMAYVANKTRGEQELWTWVKETQPSFSVNTVLPHIVLGAPFNPAEGVYTTSTWLSWLFEGKLENNPIVGFFSPPYWVVDVADSAIIHVAALLASDVNNQKLWAAGQPPISINKVLAIWRKAYPDRKIVPDFDLPEPPKQDLDRTLSTALLKRYAGRDWTPLKQTILANVGGHA